MSEIKPYIQEAQEHYQDKYQNITTTYYFQTAEYQRFEKIMNKGREKKILAHKGTKIRIISD